MCEAGLSNDQTETSRLRVFERALLTWSYPCRFQGSRVALLTWTSTAKKAATNVSMERVPRRPHRRLPSLTPDRVCLLFSYIRHQGLQSYRLAWRQAQVGPFKCCFESKGSVHTIHPMVGSGGESHISMAPPKLYEALLYRANLCRFVPKHCCTPLICA